MRPSLLARAGLALLALLTTIAALYLMLWPCAEVTSATTSVDLLFAWSCIGGSTVLAVGAAFRHRRLLVDRPALSVAVLCVGAAVCLTMGLSYLLADSLRSPAYFAIYMVFVGPFQLLLVLLYAVVLSPLALLWSPSRYWLLLDRICRSLALFLLVSAAVNVAWMTLVYKHFYLSQDTLIDFFPFIPFGRWVLETTFGGKNGRLLNGASLWNVQLLWGLFASIVWLTTIRLYQVVSRHLRKRLA